MIPFCPLVYALALFNEGSMRFFNPLRKREDPLQRPAQELIGVRPSLENLISYPFPTPQFSFDSSRYAANVSSSWNEGELPYVHAIIAFAELIIRYQIDTVRLEAFKSAHIIPLEIDLSTFTSADSLSNGRWGRKGIELNPWKIWALIPMTITYLHELEHMGKKDSLFPQSLEKRAPIEIERHKRSIDDCDCMISMLGDLCAPSEDTLEFWKKHVGAVKTGHLKNASLYKLYAECVTDLKPILNKESNRNAFLKGYLQSPHMQRVFGQIDGLSDVADMGQLVIDLLNVPSISRIPSVMKKCEEWKRVASQCSIVFKECEKENEIIRQELLSRVPEKFPWYHRDLPRKIS